MKIAVLLTCHNRALKTKESLISLKNALISFNEKVDRKICMEIFMTDDGCTDNTVEVSRNVFPEESVLHILRGDGNLYWAGGMRYCWQEALNRRNEWDYYLLLNDDTILLTSCLKELLKTEKYVEAKFGVSGIVSGITCATDDNMRLTYGGDVWQNKFLGTTKRLPPSNEPQMCDFTNANILLIPSTVVNKIGIFDKGYQHANADYDYSNKARKCGIPVVITANFCGKCDNDHKQGGIEAEKVMNMTLKERINYYNNPVRSYKDYLYFVKRITPQRLPFVLIGRMFNIYIPKFYYFLSGYRSQNNK